MALLIQRSQGITKQNMRSLTTFQGGSRQELLTFLDRWENSGQNEGIMRQKIPGRGIQHIEPRIPCIRLLLLPLKLSYARHNLVSLWLYTNNTLLKNTTMTCVSVCIITSWTRFPFWRSEDIYKMYVTYSWIFSKFFFSFNNHKIPEPEINLLLWLRVNLES